MSVRRLLATAAVALLGAVGLATPAVAHVSAQSTAAGVDTMSSGRLGAIVAALVGLTGVVVGGLALARATGRIGDGTDNGGNGAIVALVTGLIALALGGLVVATSDGGLGTGNGLGGALVALIMGLIAVDLGWLTLARAHRARRAHRTG